MKASYVVVMLFLVSCSAANGQSPSVGGYVGDVDNKMLLFFQNAAPNSDVQISSFGGDPAYGFRIAKIIQSKHLSISVKTACISACAEYILAPARAIRFMDNALIGLHGNDFIYDSLAKRTKTKEYCSSGRLAFMREIYKSKGLSLDFYKETIENLRIRDYKPPHVDACDATIIKDVSIWFPTSYQLRNDWGLQFTGNVCADDRKCISNVMETGFRGKGLIVRFGSSDFTTK